MEWLTKLVMGRNEGFHLCPPNGETMHEEGEGGFLLRQVKAGASPGEGRG